jgi:hypothetical protein
MSARITPCLVFVALVGCAGPDRTESPPPTTGGTTASTSTQAATCMPSGLEAAHEVEVVRLPAGCSFSGAGSLEAPVVLADEAALAAGVLCADGASPTIALGEDQLMVARFTMSPAFGGMAIVDDGTTVTYVMRDRPPCPGDPMPMPTPASALAYRLPRGATRTFRQLACTLPRSCS